MGTDFSISKLVAVLAVAITSLGGVLWAGDGYTVVELGNLRQGGSSVGRHMDSVGGRVVGTSGLTHGSNMHAFVWSAPTGMRDLGTFEGGDYSEAFGVNDAGTVVGNSNTRQTMRGFVWNAQEGMRELSPLPGDFASRAFAINNSGQVVGFSSGKHGVRAVVWSAQFEVRSLGTLTGGNYSEAYAINNAGHVVGMSTSSSGTRPFLWTSRDGMVDLGILPGAESCKAARINNVGQVVGSCTAGSGSRPFLWSKEGGMQSMGSLGGKEYAEALGINDSGEVVGTSETSLGARAFLWTKARGVQDVNSLIPPTHDVLLTQALQVNNRGQILAVGSFHHDVTHDREADLEDEMHAGPLHVFLLTPFKSLSSDMNATTRRQTVEQVTSPASKPYALKASTSIRLWNSPSHAYAGHCFFSVTAKQLRIPALL
jgi:probable HAF family extracellular repeat protein